MQQDRWNGIGLKLLIDRGKDQKSSECLLTTLSFSILQNYSSTRFTFSDLTFSECNFTFYEFSLTPFFITFKTFKLLYISRYIPSIPSRRSFYKIFVTSFNSTGFRRDIDFSKGEKPPLKKRFGRRMFAEKSQPAYPVYSGLMTRLRTFVRVTCSFRGGERENYRARALIMHRWLPVDGHKWADDRPR